MVDEAIVKQEGEPVLQFTVMLQNRAGSLGSMVRMVRNAKIEVIGLSVQDAKDATMIRMVSTDPESLACLFMERGISYTTCELVVVALKETGEGLGRCLDTLMAAETNVDFAYGLLVHPERQSLLALHLEDHVFGREILTRAGFKVFYQEDLSR